MCFYRESVSLSAGRITDGSPRLSVTIEETRYRRQHAGMPSVVFTGQALRYCETCAVRDLEGDGAPRFKARKQPSPSSLALRRDRDVAPCRRSVNRRAAGSSSSLPDQSLLECLWVMQMVLSGAGKEPERFQMENEVFGCALDPNLRIALARQRVVRAIDFSDQ
jgi:hypothetical protein